MITIITVCLNAADELEKTIQSVLMQRDCEIEYIIKDGVSKDHTRDVVAKYLQQLNQLKRFVFVSEKDTGLYDAMNYATKMATGNRVQFLNSGDCLFHDQVIANIEALQSDADIVYGDYAKMSEGRYHICKAIREDIPDFKGKMNFSHQALFIKTEVMQELLYDTQYPICADYEFFQRAYASGKTYQHIEDTVISFLMGGISYQHAFDLLDETYDIQYKHGIVSREECDRLHKRNHFKRFTRSLIPQKLYEALKARKRKAVQKKWAGVDGVQK